MKIQDERTTIPKELPPVSQGDNHRELRPSSSGISGVPAPEQVADPALRNYAKAYQLINEGKLEAYSGKYVAILDCQVVGADSDERLLLQTVAREHGANADECAVVYLSDMITI